MSDKMKVQRWPRTMFRVKYTFKDPVGNEHSGIAEEANWYLLTQSGIMLEHAPMRPIKECDPDKYSELTPLFKIRDTWMSLQDIELVFNEKQGSKTAELRSESILFCAEMMYRKDNPDSKMDVPSIVYEQIEKKYDEWNKAKK